MANNEIGTQFHAEYQSQVLNPSVGPVGPRRRNTEWKLTPRQKPYLGFVAASAGCLDEVVREHQQVVASKPVNVVKA